MKTTPYFILTLLTFTMLAFLPNSFAQDDTSEYVVRVIYFYPNDIEPQESVPATLSSLVKDVQKFFADEMERHGFDRKTFKLETDENDQLIVQQVIGKFDNTHYYTHYYGDPSRYGAAETEINDKIDRSKNVIYLSWIDLYNPNTVEFQISGIGSGSSSKGRVLLRSTNFDFANIERIPQNHYIRAWTVIFHELGHAFGLNHDFRNDVYIMSYGAAPDQLSYCAAKWLRTHRYFNTNETAINDNTMIKMLTPEVNSTQISIRLKFEIADPDGLHHAMLITQAAQGLIDCKELSGYSSTVEFVTTNITADSTVVSLGVMDSHGNFKTGKFSVSISSFLASKVVPIPDANLAKAVHEALALTPTTSITQLDMLKLTTLKRSEKQEHEIFLNTR